MTTSTVIGWGNLKDMIVLWLGLEAAVEIISAVLWWAWYADGATSIHSCCLLRLRRALAVWRSSFITVSILVYSHSH